MVEYGVAFPRPDAVLYEDVHEIAHEYLNSTVGVFS